MKDTLDEQNPRQAWMSLIALAPEGRVAQLLDAAEERPAFKWLRPPEIGSTMVRGRAGATGAPFNLGEMTVTRCALTLDTGEVGHAYIQGRRKADAEAAALVDAMMQTALADKLRETVLEPIKAEMKQAKTTRAAKAAATKVEFFTMTRGED
ncbi:phosphonate C-P lyase system protein PhnG [Sulfitobacter aestuariivivens]|uniref:Phosphonate C-P lyase system protein PhnG n=1 Tax=Sulfitobacter aestuariivivens TaxID=2766981 RepID=A0A927HFD9_9RHOB|nr:phosphonate C-P lyase system protein PhnG [Sulfitobacter aestuariivivens]MBD3665737.1 phosphonate C-P lyase system protein PhnG [Sulfitobacter aestuariivivens]